MMTLTNMVLLILNYDNIVGSFITFNICIQIYCIYVHKQLNEAY